ncbi:MAG: DUF2461 domain-containing protein [Marinilabiliaceae bacterium]|jgi:uncharacterized protein (TIGR02453 family)|nr:DUF2461 domain-containing protein [Marinilabiliaceae bacterium]
MEKLHSDTIQFFRELGENNNRDWFLKNKARYQDIRESFIQFLDAVYPWLCEFDPAIKGIDVRKSVFRINRDVRFSNDKSPYKTSLAAVLIAGGRRNFSEKAGYYLHIEPGQSIIAGGAYLPPAAWINRIRKEIDADPEAFRRILERKDFVKYFGSLGGDRLKGAPRGYDRDNPNLDLLRYKSFLAVNEVSDEEVLSDKFAAHYIEVAKAMKPLNDFLNWEE